METCLWGNLLNILFVSVFLKLVKSRNYFSLEAIDVCVSYHTYVHSDQALELLLLILHTVYIVQLCVFTVKIIQPGVQSKPLDGSDEKFRPWTPR